ncbi:Gfo/Idh/MocA family protein [Dehalogenimonas formicexedens]|nr:Gfo/Idh/MocA family oxidoreductase [Dehalogenimonas formicexedens]
MLKVAIIGLGTMGQHHVRVYSELGCDIVGLVDTDEARGKEFAQKYGSRWFSDYHDILDKAEAVSIAVPTSLHSLVAIDCLNKGIHCLVEKPIASTVDEARSMIEAAQKHAAKLMIGHIERFNPAVLKLKSLLDEGILGKLMIVSTRRVGPFAPRIRDVGIIIDSATHDIDVIRFLMNRDPVHVYAKSGSFRHEKEDHSVIVCDFGDAVGSIEVNWFTPHKVRTLVATGSEGIAYLDYIQQDLRVFNSVVNHDIVIEKGEPLKLELAHFLDCIITGKTPLTDGESSTKVLEIALEATQPRGTRVYV